MIDRFGKTVRVSWSAREILWLSAAMSLPRAERSLAYRDISDMSGRSVAAISKQAYEVGCAAVTGTIFPPPPTLRPSQIRALTPYELMVGRANPIRPRPANSRGRDRAPADCTSHPPKAQRAAYCRSGDLSGGANA